MYDRLPSNADDIRCRKRRKTDTPVVPVGPYLVLSDRHYSTHFRTDSFPSSLKSSESLETFKRLVNHHDLVLLLKGSAFK